MGLVRLVLLLALISSTLAACGDAISTHRHLNNLPMAAAEKASSSNNRLRRSLKAIDADEQTEERAIALKGLTTKVKTQMTAYNAKAAAKAKKLTKLRTAMMAGKLPKFHNSPFASNFLAGKMVDDVAKTLRSAGNSEAKITTFTTKYKEWLKILLKVRLPKTKL